jgi:glycosyltransferase involved in cell wall biosynthesis
VTVAPTEVELVVEQLRRPVGGGIGTYCRGLIGGIGELPEGERPHLSLYASRWPGARGVDPLSQLGLPLRSAPVGYRLLSLRWDRGHGIRRRDEPPSGVIHATSFTLPPRSDRPLVVTVHDLAWRHVPDAFPARGRAWHERALSRAAREAAAFVVPSSSTADDLAAAGLGIATERIHIIEEGADHLAAPDPDGARALLEAAGIGAGDGYLLTVGTLEPRKNLARVIAAYLRCRSRLPEPWPLLVVGPKGWGDAVPSSETAGVVACGHVSDGVLRALYGRARCVAYVPLHEGFGLPAVEAMSCGAPVVASTRTPSARSGALLADPFDVEAIAGALVSASSDEATRDGLIAAGRARADELTWRATAAAHAQLWRSVAGAPSASGPGAGGPGAGGPGAGGP